MPLEFYRTQRELRPRLALVVPTWFPPDHPLDSAAHILATNLADLDTVFEPEQCLVVADGSPVAAAAAQRVQAAQPGLGVRLLDGGPHGKGGAVAHGFRELLDRTAADWFLVRDHDGDHFLNDAPRLVRLAVQMREESGVERILVNGGRQQPSRPMGWVRAEYERLVNDVVWHGLHYQAARREAAVDESWLEPHRPLPDLQSGYKCYSREAAEHLVACSLAADFAMRRWGCEVLATVEVVATGGLFGEVQRATLDGQPLTTYEGGEARARLHGDILCWVAGRLELPADCLATWLDAAIARGELRTLGPARDEVMGLREYVLTRVGAGDAWLERAPRAPWFC